MTFKEYLIQSEAFEKTNDYKKRRLGSITGAAKRARRGGGIASVVNPADLSKPPSSNPSGQAFKGIDIGGPIYNDSNPKIIEPFKKQRYLPSNF